MEIKIFDIQGKMVAERHYFPGEPNSNSSFSIAENQPGIYIVNIIIDDIVKIRKMRLR